MNSKNTDKNIDNGEKLIKSEADTKCAPTFTFTDGSCIPLDIIIKIAKNYNKTSNCKIKLDNTMEVLQPKKYKKYLVNELNKAFPDCKNQACWLDKLDKIGNKYQEKLKDRIFRPIGPQGKFEWLNTININQVMNQYTDKYKDFLFLGAVPIDFYEINAYKIKDLNYKDLLNEGISKLGIVFNLDDHTQPGSHWVSGLIDLKNGNIYYYDSYGTRPGKRVREFYHKIANFMANELGIKPNIEYNKKRHQYKDSECGMFSMHFIISLLDGEDFESFCNSQINDDDVNKLREEYFIIKKK